MDPHLEDWSDGFRQVSALEKLSVRVQISVELLEKRAAEDGELREVLTDLSRCHATLAQLLGADTADLAAVREYRELLEQLSEEAEHLALHCAAPPPSSLARRTKTE